MAGPDLSIVTAAVDFSGFAQALVGALAALVVAYIAVKGAKIILAAVRGGDGYELDPEGFDPYEDYSYSEYARDNRAAGLPVLSESEFDRLK